jgi:hypothetical protein
MYEKTVNDRIEARSKTIESVRVVETAQEEKSMMTNESISVTPA